MHDRRRTRAEDDGGSVGVQVEEARVGGPLPTADLRIAPGDLLVILPDVLAVAGASGILGGWRVLTDKPNFRRMQLHPGILGCRARNLIHKALLDPFVVLAGNRADAPFQKTVCRERTRIVAGGETSDDAWKRVERVRIQRMRYRRDPLRLKIRDRFHDLVAEFDAADPLVALLDAGGLAVNLDFEPDAADACGLHRQVARLAGNASVSFVPTDHRIQGAVTADFLIDDDVDVD